MKNDRDQKNEGPEDVISVMAEAVGSRQPLRATHVKFDYPTPTDETYALGAHEVAALAQSGRQRTS